MAKEKDVYSELYHGRKFTVWPLGKRWCWQIGAGKLKDVKTRFAASKENAIKKARRYIDGMKEKKK